MKKNQEKVITIFCFLYYSSALLADYYGNTGYFDHASDAFYLSYAFALCERNIIDRIPKFSYRTAFSISLTILRLVAIPGHDKGLLVLQVVYLAVGIYLDMDKEKHSREFFLSYFKNKEQLDKFKDLVVQDIPESILIVSKDLMKSLFFNNSFKSLIDLHPDSLLNIHAQLDKFKVQDDSDASSQSLIEENVKKESSLFSFLNGIIHNNVEIPLDKKFSCVLKYIKTDSPIQQIQAKNSSNHDQQVFEAKILHIIWDEQPAFAILLHDITQQNTIINLKIAADLHKDKVLATVSHELRTPLNGILGMVQIMQKLTKDQDLLHYLDICKNSGNLLLGLVNSILDLNQIRANKFKLYTEKVLLREMLKDIVRLFEFQCAQKGLYLQLEIPSEAPKSLVTDKNRLSQIFINLIGNALKFTSKGGINISASTKSEEYLMFSIQDSGIGIKPEDQTKLFKTFGKLEHENNPSMNQQGVGLGLTISDSLAKLLCKNESLGGIKVQSEYNKGSQFSFIINKNLASPQIHTENISHISILQESNANITHSIIGSQGEVDSKIKIYSTLPIKSRRASEEVNVKQQNSSNIPLNTYPRLSGPNRQRNSCDLKPSSLRKMVPIVEKMSPIEDLSPYILVVDDNPFNIAVTERMISYNKYRVKTALSGQAAIDLLTDNDFIKEPMMMVLMDCEMPIMNGMQATKNLKRMMNEGKIPEIPIVALTANEGEYYRKACKDVGMCDYLTKPLKEKELVKVLNVYDKKNK